MNTYKKGDRILAEGNYVFFDTETANSNQDICQIGAIVLEDGIIIDNLCYYVKPYDNFEYAFVKKHGITPNIVYDCPTFDIIWKTYFQKYIDDFIFVAHNAEFDINAIDKSLQAFNIKCQDLKYLCSQDLAENKIVEDISKSRESLCNFFDFEIEKSHDAYSDAIDCMNIYKKILETYKFNISDFIKSYISKSFNRKKIEEKNLYDKFENYKMSKFSSKEINNRKQNEEFDLDFAGQIITITGDFIRYPKVEGGREKLADLLHKLGAKKICSSSNLAKSTTMLIAGTGAGKKEKAKAWGIKIIDEETLYKMLDNGNEILN